MTISLPQALLAVLNGRERYAFARRSGPAGLALIAKALRRRGGNAAIIVPGLPEAEQIGHLLEVVSGDYPARADAEWVRFGSPVHPDFGGRMWPGLFRLSEGGPAGVLICADALISRWPDRESVTDLFFPLERGMTYSPEALGDLLASWGYVRVKSVERQGHFAARGDIVDVFSPGCRQPVRCDFFGDSVEDMRFFEPVGQRSLESVREIVLFPATGCPPISFLSERAQERIAALHKTGDLSARTYGVLREALEQGTFPELPGLYYPRPLSLREWLPADTVFLLWDVQAIKERMEEVRWILESRLNEQFDGGVRADLVLEPLLRAKQTWVDHPQIFFGGLEGRQGAAVDLDEKNISRFDDLPLSREERERPWQGLIRLLKTWISEGRRVALAFRTDRSRRRFVDMAGEEGLAISLENGVPSSPGATAVLADLRGGQICVWCNIVILSEDVLQPGRRRRVKARDAFVGLQGVDEISEGDLIVHRDYGLGRFAGLTRLCSKQACQDYFLIRYAEEDKLYLPVDRLGLIQRYKGPEHFVPTLDDLGGTRWRAAKEKARKAIEAIAGDLVSMYAYRKISKGYAYGPAGEDFREFEASFGFQETLDQARAITEVLHDMEKSEPMDRLVCGDVGFGKTEVAMRAAFRAVMDGKQVIVLCPTTVLAEQHLQTFQERMERFPVNVAMLSRFVPPSRQKQIVADAKAGRVDILIGTHRVLSKDVDMPALGLLVLDEEQRFGVRHKERIKAMRRNVDVLTLTATPIPRTLQLSLSGVRSLSVIETPPEERKPVQTAIIGRDRDTLQAILQRELEREGQIFWVHNRIQGLEAAADFVRDLMPQARVASAHGQMAVKQLEDVMHAFWKGTVDVLVCTSIIESGLDFPRANTLVVENADRFGLGQLYQLKGRVGRSDRQAFAYFLVPHLDRLKEDARRRLEVISDMEYLGAGFQLAMEDLRLRGAGNILGEAQSGNIQRIGLDLFLDMLEEEVARQRGENRVPRREVEVSSTFDAYIPEAYVPEVKDRLRFYDRLAQAGSEAELHEIEQELGDRFGALPPPVSTFLEIVRLKQVFAVLGIEKADIQPGRVILRWEKPPQGAEAERIISWVTARGAKARFRPENAVEALFAGDVPPAQALCALRLDISSLAGVE